MNEHMITYASLCALVESDRAGDTLKEIAELLLDALDDWPTFELKGPEELLLDLHKEVQVPLTFDNLQSHLHTMSPELGDNPWKMESFKSLLELFDYNRTGEVNRIITLDELLSRITEDSENIC